MAQLERIEGVGLVPARLNWDIKGAGNLGSALGEIVIAVEGASWLNIDMRGAYSLTWLVEVSRDGVNFIQVPVSPAGQLGAWLAQVTGTGALPFNWFARVAGYAFARVRTTAWVSGAADVVLATSMNSYPPTGGQPSEPIPLAVRPALVAANTAVTVTIPAGGVGLYTIIHQILVWGQNNTAAAIAWTASQNITSTNLGALAWAFSNAYAAGEKKALVSMDIENGYRAAVANTASTIVIPALGAGIVTEACVLYKLGA